MMPNDVGRSPNGSGSRPSDRAAAGVSPVSIPNARHPAKSAAQRRVLDEIGCGNHSPIMAKATRDKLLRAGLIVELKPDLSKSFGPLRIAIQRFEMPIPVHMQWCAYWAEQEDAAG